MSGQWELIEPYLARDHANQVRSTHYIGEIQGRVPKGAIVLDLGCGVGRSRAEFLKAMPHCSWIGVDIIGSPEVMGREGHVPNLVSYDGTQLPFSDASLDCVYSNQVLEHVRYPDAVLSEVARVLKPEGLFIGSTSHLEPYHSFSYWNFTPWGFSVLAEDAGLEVLELRPGIDGITLIERAYKGRPPEMSRFFGESSPLNTEIDEWGGSTKRKPAQVNNRKLQFCGQFSFLVRRPSGVV